MRVDCGRAFLALEYLRQLENRATDALIPRDRQREVKGLFL